MHEHRKTFQGIDTCNITTVGNFSFPSIILEESELHAIKTRPDINALLRNLRREKFLTE